MVILEKEETILVLYILSLLSHALTNKRANKNIITLKILFIYLPPYHRKKAAKVF